MKRNSTFTILFLLAFATSFAQNSLNDYKYVIVPDKYEFLKTADEYRLNWLTKSLFNDLKFRAIMDDDALPEELKNNTCLALKADVLEESNMFKTKLKIQLKNCDGEVVYTSGIGESREKNYKKTYHEALRMAFKFLEAENYNYKPSETILAKAEESNQEVVEQIKKLKEEIRELKADKKDKVNSNTKKQNDSVYFIKGSFKEHKEKENKVSLDNKPKAKVDDTSLAAELIPGSVFSYEVKNNSGELLYTLLFSGQEDVYMVKGKDALVYKINGVWAIAQYEGDELLIKSLDLKF